MLGRKRVRRLGSGCWIPAWVDWRGPGGDWSAGRGSGRCRADATTRLSKLAGHVHPSRVRVIVPGRTCVLSSASDPWIPLWMESAGSIAPRPVDQSCLRCRAAMQIWYSKVAECVQWSSDSVWVDWRRAGGGWPADRGGRRCRTETTMRTSKLAGHVQVERTCPDCRAATARKPRNLLGHVQVRLLASQTHSIRRV